MLGRSFVAAALLLLLIYLSITLSGCEAAATRSVSSHFPRIVLVSIDTLNVLYTDPYNPDAGLTPHLEGLASEGVLFELAHTSVPQTLPSHTAILTGRTPLRTGVMINGDRVPEETVTWAELLQEHGWDTAGFVSLGVLRRQQGLDQGFDTYEDRILGRVNRWYLRSSEVLDQVLPWLEAHREDPFFLWVHLSDPHAPYEPTDPPLDTELSLDGERLGAWGIADGSAHIVSFELTPGRHRLTWRSLRPRGPEDRPESGMRVQILNPQELEPWIRDSPTPIQDEIPIRDPWEVDLIHSGSSKIELSLRFTGRLNRPPQAEAVEKYSQEVRLVDHHVGVLRRWFQESGLDEGTLWVVVSDHGEGLRRAEGHARNAFEVQLRTMWMMTGPGLPAGRRIGTVSVQMEDVMPTVFDLLGLPTPEDLDGVSRRGCWTGEECRPRKEWWGYGADVDEESITAIAGYRWPFKASWHGKEPTGRRLHDLSTDPWEWTNLADREDAPRPAAALLQVLDLRRDFIQRRLDERAQGPPDTEDREMLKALGYL